MSKWFVAAIIILAVGSIFGGLENRRLQERIAKIEQRTAWICRLPAATTTSGNYHGGQLVLIGGDQAEGCP